MTKISIRPMNLEEAQEVSQFVYGVFDKFIAPDYSDEGICTFKKINEPGAIEKRNRENHFVLIAMLDNVMAGVIEIRDSRHISMLYVDGKYQNRGIAKSLLTSALDKIRKQHPKLDVITVNSSPYAIKAYEKLGFQRIDEEQVVQGLRFVPMRKCLLN
ncbi:GNAT family N-acetyltransferase [Bacillus thermotolerans]|uniref:GNAT family N-acetyltransferase n=1 Tax=Bacillus thermotolerans TaxID=1221996 RepID=UPI0005831A32|nr:GNAT family N-acetyltransferase [Bacillus thermotolerans]KKB37794.1 Histone acetyltransferase HPA2 [Bacillus thermotolerans]